MSGPICELEGASIVLVGAFNPLICQPSWLAANGLLRPEEADAATSGEDAFVMVREMAVFKAGWLELQVTGQRFSAQTSDPAQYNPLRDLVLGVFRLLEHTPFSQMGLNRLMHYKMPSDEDYNAFGDFLAPKKAWQGLHVKPGLLTLRITGPKPGVDKVRCTTKVEPSTRVRPGVFIETNEHHQAEGEDSAKTLMKTLETSWQTAQDDGRKVAEQLFSSFYEGK